MIRTLPLFLASGFALSVSAQAAQQTEQQCHPTEEKQISALFERWNDDLASGDPKRVVENYAKESILLPTVSNTPRRTADEKADYFAHFLEKKPSGAVDERMIQIDCNTALDAGIYTFTFNDGNTVKARYTFTYKWFPDEQQWLITSHHSSAMPEVVTMVD
jgi:uncharacterized protein (TIGR02246 family)